MKTLATAFKEVYGEALKEYGFKKVKGKYPYYARVVGDEIVHVITYASRPSLKDGYNGFVILGGVATVYRACINFDVAPSQNLNWLNGNLGMFKIKNKSQKEYSENFSNWYIFEYLKSDEVTLLKSINYSLKVTTQVMLPLLESVIDVKSCVEFFEETNFSMLYLYIDENYGKFQNSGEYNEGFLNVLLYNKEQYVEKMKKIEKNIDEKDEQKKILIMNMISNQINRFEMVMNNLDENERIIKEIQHRKAYNTERLKQYGLI